MKYLFPIILLLTISSCKNDKITSTDNTNYKYARFFRESKVLDSAFYYYNLAKNDYLKIKDSLGAGKSLVNMAMIQTQKGDFYGGIESSLEANKYLKRVKDSTTRSTLATNYNNIAFSSNFLKNFDQSLKYYFKTLEYIDENNSLKFICYNNIGDVLITQGKFSLAEKYLEKAISAKEPSYYSMALNNLAKAKYLNNKNYNPLPELYKALEIRKNNNDNEGLNSSYETLSEYFILKDKSLSLDFAKKMLLSANKNKSSKDQILALKKIIKLDPINYLESFQKLDSISTIVQTERSKAKNQFAVVRYDVEQKNAQNQTLKTQSFKQSVSIVSLAIILITGFFWNEKRKKNIRREKEQEKQLEVKNTELRYSKKVHDVVANGIYQVMTKIENQDSFSKEEALDELEFVYEKSRDISYEKPDSPGQEFGQIISNLIASFKNDNVNTFTVGNEEKTWHNITEFTKTEIYQIIRELLVNMKKHSRATNVIFKFEKIDNQVNIGYSDNGIGVSDELTFKNGLSNTVSRIESINGKIIFDTKTEKGLKINISFPVS
ncbi:tetratricopeptide repeat-containing sensor histidine kinase [Chryseobacterium luquanense]|uniref:Tetratricopeptide repeat protein n=1 Tax=Chryseobacterium luquanense TaxID=2983766 RepID=A0ABT3Y583_9FLAO|nr:tetratricopeptide repeat protein [Chryseobacterium luquanense]MCX8533236.1 tetratricopeptide repeat protein [Chryseobacterium luquanense]